MATMGSLARDLSWAVHYWEIEPGRLSAIKGLFEADNPLRAARYVQERIHFVGFVREHDLFEGEIRQVGYYLANPHLFSTQEEGARAFEGYPIAQRGSPS